jgi:hypothetical protein
LRRFSAVWIPGISIEWFYTAMPNLTDIQVSEPQEDLLFDLFSRLDRTQHTGFLPHLRSLALVNCDPDLQASVSGALVSRCTANEKGSRLESFQYVEHKLYHISLEETTVVCLWELVERGM